MALTENSIAVTQKQVTGFGELSLATATIKQGHVKLLFQVLDLQTDRWLRDVKTVSSFFEAAFADDGAKDTQLIQCERQIGHKRQPTRQG
jgi:hypothetical protein